MAERTYLYDDVVHVTHTYLGPAAERFVARQVNNHLRKPPEAMTAKDLLKLIDWIRVAVSLLTDDSAVIEEYIAKLHMLARDEQIGKRKTHGN